MSAPDFEAMALRLTAYVLSLRNTAVDPDEPLFNDVFEMIGNGQRGNTGPHQTPSFGFQHDGARWPENKLLGGGVGEVSQEGDSLWRFAVLVDSPEHLLGMGGPRGARVITKQLIEALSNWPIDEENGYAVLSITSQIRYEPPDEDLRDECGYYIEATHPANIDGETPADEEEEG